MLYIIFFLFLDTFLNNLTATQVQTIDINLYLQICESNPEKIFTKQYIHWYLLKDQSHFMTNELEDEVHFSCKMARISPNESHIVFACYDKSIIVWDYIKHQTVHIPLKTHKSTKITCLAFSSNGHKIASISSKNTFVIWDIHTTSQNNLLSYEGLKEGIKCLAFSNDDTKVALGSKEGNLIVYDTFNGQIIMGPLPGHEAKVKCVAFSPNNTKICTGGQDKIILLWDVESKQMIKRLKGHRNEVLSLVFDPMGEIIVSGGKDKNVLIWDVAKGRELFDPLKGHKNAISIIAMAPNGLRFASGGRDKMIIFWDLTMGHIIFGPLEGHQKKIEDLRYSSDSKCLFSASIDNSVIIWDADKGIILKKPLQSYSIKSSVRAITPNGLTMIVANGRKDENDGSFTIWNALTAQPSGVSIKAHTDSIKAMVCSPNNKLLITGGKDRKIIVWNLEKTNEVLYGPLEEHKDEITCLAYASDNKTFASGSRIAELKVWDTFKGTPFPFEFSGHSGRITTLEFDIQGEKLISGDHFHNVNVWSVQSGKNLLSYTHLTPITASTFSFDSNKVVTGSEDGQIKIWDLREKEPQPKNLQAHKKGITAIVFSHDGLKIATASKNVEIKVWDCAKKVVLFIGPLAGHHFPIYHLLFSDDDSFLNSASSDCSKTWKIWCVSSEKTFPIEYTFDVSPDGRWIVAPGKENTDLLIYNSLKGYALYHIMRSHLNKVNFAFFSPDSQRILSGSDDCSLMLWDSISGKPALGPLKGHSGPVYVGTFSRSGNKIASGGSDKTIILWDGKTGKPLFEQALRGHTDDIYTMEFSADEMRLVSGGDDGKIIVWDCLDGTMLFDPIEAHEDWITCVKFSWDGIKLYSSSFDTTIKVWNSDSGELLDTLKAHNQSVYSIKFSPDHNKMVSVSNDRKAIIWDSNSRCNCQFSRERVFQTGVKAVHWSDNDDLFFVFDEEIKCYFNYFSNEELFFSKGLILSDFYRDPERFSDDELMSILDGNIGEIVPFYYTFLHVVAYTDDHQRFFQSRILKLLKIKNKTIDFLAFFKKDIHNNSCVDIILKKNNKNLMRIVFKYIAKSYRPSELYAHGFADKITVNLLYQILMIFGNDTSLIIKLIDMCFDTPVDYPDLFTFKGFDEEFSLAIKEPKINAHKIEDIINMNDSEKKGWLDQILSKENPFPTQEIIIAKTFYLKDILNLDKGVALDFFRKISSLDSDNPIFANETFKKIIHHKWDSYARF